MSFLKKLKKDSEEPALCTAVIAAAGSSERMEGEDKQFIEMLGMPVLAFTLAKFEACALVGEIIIVARQDKLERVRDICAEYGICKASKVVAGGSTRLESVMNGVLAASDKAQFIAIHDGARPCITENVIERAIKAAWAHHAAAPAVPVSSTIKKAKGGVVLETVSREDLFEIQTPQVFAAEIIKAALTNARDKSINVTDDCMAVELMGVPVYITEGSRSNIKLTTRDDIAVAEAILKQEGMRV